MELYENPIILNNPKDNTWDPYVLRHGDYYYHCFSNAEGVFISKAEKLWDIGAAEPQKIYDSTENGALKRWYAPELHYIGGKWYVYAAPEYSQRLHTMTVLVGEGDTPICEYKNAGIVKGLEGKWTIDGTVMSYENELYFIWTRCREMYIAKMRDPRSITGDVTVLTRPELAFETKVGLIAEGPAVLHKNGKVHVVYSANDSKCDEYCLGLLTYDGTGDILDAECWKKSPEAVFEKTDKVFGPGHCSFTTVTVDGREEDYIVYHGNLVSGSGWSGRCVFTQPFEWDGEDFPVFGKPIF